MNMPNAIFPPPPHSAPPPPPPCFMRFKSPNLQNSLPPPPQSLIATAGEDLSAPPPNIFDLSNAPIFPSVQDEDFRGGEKRISLVTKKDFPGFWLGNSNARQNSDGGY